VTPTSPVTGVRLVATTVALDRGVDLAEVAGGQGCLWDRAGALSLAGRGVAARVRVPWGGGALGEAAGDMAQVSARLGAIEWEGPFPPVALGAFPFARAGFAELVVPALLVRRRADGSCWLTVTASDPERALDEARRRLASLRQETGGPRPRQYRVTSVMERGAWCRLVDDAILAVAAGQLAKVVLAREVCVEADQPLRPTDIARRLRRSHPSCTVFSIDGFVGASPELLVERHGDQVRSHPLAGTTARSGPGDGEEGGIKAGSGHETQEHEMVSRLLSSAKERGEHRLVVDAVAAALAPFCDDLRVPELPAVVPLGTLAHLGTLITGRLRDPLATALDLVDAIHPSPAVAGTPTGAALDYIADVERLDRGRYAGPVGWVDADGDGCFAVGIRSAQIEGPRARVIAGAGIVDGSDPGAELAETDLKLQPVLAAIVRP